MEPKVIQLHKLDERANVFNFHMAMYAPAVPFDRTENVGFLSSFAAALNEAARQGAEAAKEGRTVEYRA